MFFWIMFGTGVDVICELLVQPRPPNTSNAAMKIREQVLDTEQHTKLAWHPNIHFEIQGIRSVKQGKADFALRDVILTSDPEVIYSFQFCYYIIYYSVRFVTLGRRGFTRKRI